MNFPLGVRRDGAVESQRAAGAALTLGFSEDVGWRQGAGERVGERPSDEPEASGGADDKHGWSGAPRRQRDGAEGHPDASATEAIELVDSRSA